MMKEIIFKLSHRRQGLHVRIHMRAGIGKRPRAGNPTRERINAVQCMRLRWVFPPHYGSAVSLDHASRC